ncbi:eCIS core domain-containing protein [Primorskyibacter sp. 2E107]|uniref:eCIS core domain-containing protein n=1 Tax=Primorskyibacter sp. 2E107 TaxID=3403458 RepID=UPI003AF8DA3D
MTRQRQDQTRLTGKPATGRVLEDEARKAAQGRIPVLSRAPAARLPGDAGVGRPVGGAVLGRLQDAFDADLDGLTIHDGPRAAALAEQAGARAFAAGPHLVFAKGAYRPETTRGFALLRHETAHALQQSGMADSAGLRLITGGAKAGPIQREDKPESEQDKAARGYWKEVIDLYAAAKPWGGAKDLPFGKDYDTDLAALTKAADGKLYPAKRTPHGASIATFVKTYDFKSLRGASLAADILTLSAEYQATLDLIRRIPTLEQLFRPIDLTTFAVKAVTAEELVQIFVTDEKSPFVLRQWTAMVDRIEALATTVGPDIPMTSPVKRLFDEMDTATAMDKTKPNILQHLAISAMGSAEDFFLRVLRKAGSRKNAAQLIEQTGIAMSPGSPVLQAMARLTVLNRDLKTLTTAYTGNNAFTPVAAALLLPPVQGRMMRFNSAFGVFQNMLTSLGGGLFQFASLGTRGKLTIPDALTTFLDALSDMAKVDAGNGAFTLLPASAATATGETGSDGKLTTAQQTVAFLARMPEPADFDTRRRTMVSQIRDKALDLRKTLNGRKTPNRAAKETHFDGISALVLSLLWVDWFTGYADEAGQSGGRDANQVAAARYNLARGIGAIGQLFGHATLSTEAFKVSRGRDAGLSYAVIPEWEFTEDTKIKYATALPEEITTIGKDRPGPDGKVDPKNRTEFAVPMDVLVEFYQIDFLRQALPKMTEEIARQQEIVERNKKTATSKEEDLPPGDSIQRILDGVEQRMQKPRKWVAEGGALVRNPTDKARPLEVLLRHPAVAARMGEPGNSAGAGGSGIKGMWKGNLLVRQRNRWVGVDLWTLPDLSPLRDALRKVPEVRTILDAAKENKVWTEPKAVHEWLFQLYDLAKKDGTLANLRAGMRRDFDTQWGVEQRRMNLAQRKLSTLNRGIHVDYFRDRLAESVDSTETKDRHEILFDAKLTGDLRGSITAFSRSVRPKADQDIQTVALMIEVAPQLLAAISVRTGGDHIQSFFEPVALALSMATGSVVFGVKGEGASGQDGGLPAPGIKADFAARIRDLNVSDTDLAVGVKNLREILRRLDTARRESQEQFKLHGDPAKGLQTKLAGYWIDPKNDDTSKFVLALPYRSDVTESSKGWKPAPSDDATPLDRAAAESDGGQTTAKAIEPLWKQDVIYGTQNPIYYEIVTVHRRFTYTPAYKATGAARRDASLVDDKKRAIPDGVDLVTFRFAYMTQTEGQVGFTPPREVTVKAGDHQLLELLNNVVDYHGRLLQMRALGDVIEAAGSLMLDLLEFVPGAGQVLMLARLTATVIDMIVNLEWDEIREDLIDGPQEILTFLQGDLLSSLDSVDMFSFFIDSLMTGKGAASQIKAVLEKAKARKAKPKPRTGRKRKSQKYRQLMQSVSSIALNVASAFVGAQEKMGVGVNSAMARVMTSPLLSKHIDRLPLYLGYANLIEGLVFAGKHMAGALPDLTGGDKQNAKAERSGAQADFLQGGAGPKAFEAAINSMMEPLTTFELPKEVIPMDLAVQIILEMTVGRVRNAKVRIVYEALRLTGGLAKISALIAENLIKDSAANPNKIWQNDIAGKIAPAITTGRNHLVEQVFGLMAMIFPGSGMQAPNMPDITAEWGEMTLSDEIHPYGHAMGFPSLLHPMTALPLTGGVPLEPDLRTDLERRFGYDLGHLRLHDDGPAQDFVQAIGAEAAASGAHLYMGSGLDPQSDHGKHVLRHEVAHALQQTRPPALGQGTPPRPKPGQSGRGLRRDALREDGAERMARAAQTHNATSEGPMRIEGAGPQAIMPYSRTDLVDLLTALGPGSDPRTFGQMKFAQPLLTQGSKEERAAVKSLGSTLKTKVASAKPATGLSYGTSSGSQDAVRSELGKVLSEWTDDRVLRIASSATTTLTETQQKKLKTRRKYSVDLPKLIQILEGVIFAECGITVELGYNKAKPDAITSVTYQGIHFGGVRGGSDFYHHIKSQNGTVGSFDFAFVRTFLRGQFPIPHEWMRGGALKISPSGIFKRTPEIDEKLLPAWKDYTKKGATDPNAIRVDTHGNLTTNNGGGRESHHLPQYLFVEFYRGRSKKGPISIWGMNGDYWMPGFKATGFGPFKRPKGKQEYDSFEGNGFSFNLKKLDPDSGRGSGMPAVSITRETHQQGALHLTPKKTWAKGDEENAPGTQGLAMYAQYIKSITRGIKSKQKIKKTGLSAPGGITSASGFREMVDDAVIPAARSGAGANDTAAARELVDVTEDTIRQSYRMFVGVMAPQLRRQLAALEVETYRAVARKLPGYSETGGVETFPKGFEADKFNPSGWIDDVMGQLKSNNKTSYGTFYDASAW